MVTILWAHPPKRPAGPVSLDWCWFVRVLSRLMLCVPSALGRAPSSLLLSHSTAALLQDRDQVLVLLEGTD